jgi:hypothetical protein
MTKDSKMEEKKGVPKWEEWQELWKLWDQYALPCPLYNEVLID